MTARRRRPALVAGSLLLSAALVACGSDAADDPGDAAGGAGAGQETSSPSPSTTASPSPRAAPSSTPASPTAPSGSAASAELGPGEFADVVEAALDDTRGARVRVDNGLGLLGGEGTVDFRRTPTSIAMTLTSTETGDDQRLVVRILDDVLLVQDGARWLRIDIDSPANPFGRSLPDQLDPRRVLDVVLDDLVSATARGTVKSDIESDGETLTRYRAVADGPAVAQALAPDLAGQEGVVVPPTVTCDLAVGDDGLARTITVDLGSENGQLAYELTGWSAGRDVEVLEPPASQVDELPDLG